MRHSLARKRYLYNKESIDEVKTLAFKMSYPRANQGKDPVFLKDATALFNQQFQEFEKVIAICQTAQATKGLWNAASCFSTAPWFQKPRVLFGKSDFLHWKESDALNNLKKALCNYGLDLAIVCTHYPSSAPCTQFVNDIFQKLIHHYLVDEAFNLLAKKGPLEKKEFASLIATLSQKQQRNLGQRLISEVLKRNPHLDIEHEINVFNTQLQAASQDAALAVKTLAQKRRVAEAELATLIAKAFSIHDEDHLIEIFKVARSCIQEHASPSRVEHPEALKLIIRNLFALDSSQDFLYAYANKVKLNADMAKSLVTYWRKANHFSDPWRYIGGFYNKVGANSSASADIVTKENWEQLIEQIS